MADILLTIQHNGTVFSPPVKEGIQIEWERTGVPGKLTFTTVKMANQGMSFSEGDPVCLYYDNKPIFMGYVFTKKRNKEQHIEVTCYDQIRYMKNKFTYVFEDKTASQIIKALCNDFNLTTGTFEDTKYVIPAVAEENKTALDIVLSTLEETLVNTGEMYVLYDDFGKLQVKNCANMVSTTLIMEDTAENFDYTSSIDDETYNNIVLYYNPKSSKSSKSSSSSAVETILEKARGEIGTQESPSGSNNVKYNTDYYGSAVSGSAYPWCCVWVWWIFKKCGMSSLFYGGQKTASCSTAAQWYKDRGQWVTGDYKPGDIVFFDWGDGGILDHVGIVESVSDGKITCLEGNYSNKVARVVRSSGIVGAGRPSYPTSKSSTSNSSSSTNTSKNSDEDESTYIFTASCPNHIKKWGLLRYFEEVSTPSIGRNKADALLKLYDRKTRELKVQGAFGDINVRGGTLIPVKLNLGDVNTNNYMLVEKVTHKFDKDYHTMDLTLEGAWDDTKDCTSVTDTIIIPNAKDESTKKEDSKNSGTSSTNTSTPKSTSNATNKSESSSYTIGIHFVGGREYITGVVVNYKYRGKYISHSHLLTSDKPNSYSFNADTGTYCTVEVFTKMGNIFSANITPQTGNWVKKDKYKWGINVTQNASLKVIGQARD